MSSGGVFKYRIVHFRPDTFIYTTADASGFLLPQMGAYFVVESSGKIFWPNPLPQMKVRCTMCTAWVNKIGFRTQHLRRWLLNNEVKVLIHN